MDIRYNNDLVVTKGDLVLVTGVSESAQRIRDRLQTFLGEWFLDLKYGVDYRKDILVKNPNSTFIYTILKREALKSEPNAVFESFDIDLNNLTRAMTVIFTITVNGETETGVVTI